MVLETPAPSALQGKLQKQYMNSEARKKLDSAVFHCGLQTILLSPKFHCGGDTDHCGLLSVDSTFSTTLPPAG